MYKAGHIEDNGRLPDAAPACGGDGFAGGHVSAQQAPMSGSPTSEPQGRAASTTSVLRRWRRPPPAGAAAYFQPEEAAYRAPAGYPAQHTPPLAHAAATYQPPTAPRDYPYAREYCKATPPEVKYRGYPPQANAVSSGPQQSYCSPKAADYMNQASNYYMEKPTCVVQDSRLHKSNCDKQALDARYAQAYNHQAYMAAPKQAEVKHTRDYRNVNIATVKKSPPVQCTILEQRLNQQDASGYCAEYAAHGYSYPKYGTGAVSRASPTAKTSHAAYKLPTQEVMLPSNYTLQGKYYPHQQHQQPTARDYEQNLYLAQMNQMQARLPQNMLSPRDMAYVDANRAIAHQKNRVYYSESSPVEHLQYTGKTIVPINQKSPKIINYNMAEQRVPEHLHTEYLNPPRGYSSAVKPPEYGGRSVIQSGKMAAEYLMPESGWRTHPPPYPPYSRPPAVSTSADMPPRNISPRRTFQENMPVVVISPQHIGLPKVSPPHYARNVHEYLNPQMYHHGAVPKEPSYQTNTKPQMAQYQHHVEPLAAKYPTNLPVHRQRYHYEPQQQQQPQQLQQLQQQYYHQPDVGNYQSFHQSELAQPQVAVRASYGTTCATPDYREYEVHRDDAGVVRSVFPKKECDVGKSLKEFLESWEEDEEIAANLPDLVLSNNIPVEKQRHIAFGGDTKTSPSPEKPPSAELPKEPDPLNADQPLYILGATNISSESLSQYLHIQQIDRLPANIKGFYKNQLEEGGTESSETSEDKSDDTSSTPEPTTVIKEVASPNVYNKPQDESCDEDQALNLSTNRAKESEEESESECENSPESLPQAEDILPLGLTSMDASPIPEQKEKLVVKEFTTPLPIPPPQPKPEEPVADKPNNQMQENTVEPDTCCSEKCSEETVSVLSECEAFDSGTVITQQEHIGFGRTTLPTDDVEDENYVSSSRLLTDHKNCYILMRHVNEEEMLKTPLFQLKPEPDDNLHLDHTHSKSKSKSKSKSERQKCDSLNSQTEEMNKKECKRDGNSNSDELVHEKPVTASVIVPNKFFEPVEDKFASKVLPSPNNLSENSEQDTTDNSDVTNTVNENTDISNDLSTCILLDNTNSTALENIDTVKDELLNETVKDDESISSEKDEKVDNIETETIENDCELKSEEYEEKTLETNEIEFVKIEEIKENAEEKSPETDPEDISIAEDLDEIKNLDISENLTNDNLDISKLDESTSSDFEGEIFENKINKDDEIEDDMKSVKTESLEDSELDTKSECENGTEIEIHKHEIAQLETIENEYTDENVESEEKISENFEKTFDIDIKIDDTFEIEAETMESPKETIEIVDEPLEKYPENIELDLKTPENLVDVQSGEKLEENIPEIIENNSETIENNSKTIENNSEATENSVENIEVEIETPENLDDNLNCDVKTTEESDPLDVMVTTSETDVNAEINTESNSTQETELNTDSAYEQVPTTDSVPETRSPVPEIENTLTEELTPETEYIVPITVDSITEKSTDAEISSSENLTQDVSEVLIDSDETVLENIIVPEETECVVIYEENDNIVLVQPEPYSAESIQDPSPTMALHEEVAHKQEEFLIEDQDVIGSEVVIGIDDWVQNEETVVEDKKKPEKCKGKVALKKLAIEKKKQLMAQRKKKLEKWKRQRELSIEQVKKPEEKKVGSVEDKELFINPENPVMCGFNPCDDIFDVTDCRKRRLSYDEYTNLRIEFKAPKRRYSTMDVFKSAKKPIINLDEISKNITEVLQNLTKNEKVQYRTVSNCCMKVKQESDTKDIKNIDLTLLESDVMEKQKVETVESLIVKETTLNKICETNEKETCVPETSETVEDKISAAHSQQNKDLLELLESTTDLIKPTTLVPKVTLDSVDNVVPNVSSEKCNGSDIQQCTVLPSTKPPETPTSINNATPPLRISCRRRIHYPRIDNPMQPTKKEEPAIEIKPVKPLNTFGLTEYTQNFIKMKTGHSIDTKSLCSTNGVKRNDPRLTKTDESKIDLKNGNDKGEELKKKLERTMSNNNKRNESKTMCEKKIKINLQDYRNRKQSQSGSDSSSATEEKPIVNEIEKKSSPVLSSNVDNTVTEEQACTKEETECVTVENTPKKILNDSQESHLTSGVSETTALVPNATTNTNQTLDCINLSPSNPTPKPKSVLRAVRPKKRRKRFRNLYTCDDEDETPAKQAKTDQIKSPLVSSDNTNGCPSLRENSDSLSAGSTNGDLLYCLDLNSNASNDKQSCEFKCHIKLDNIRDYEINNTKGCNTKLKLTLKPVKKPKPAFEEVLSSLDTLVETKLPAKKAKASRGTKSGKNGKSGNLWTIRDSVPKVIIKRSATGYCATFRDVSNNPLWQPRIRIKRQNYIETLVLKNHM